MTDDAIQTYDKLSAETSGRVGLAVDAYKKQHPATTFQPQEIKEITVKVQAYEAQHPGFKLDQKQLIDNAVVPFVENRTKNAATNSKIGKIADVAWEVLPPVGYFVGGYGDATTGLAIAKNVAGAGKWVGLGVGTAAVVVDAGLEAYQGNYQQAAIKGTSGGIGIGAGVAAGALICAPTGIGVIPCGIIGGVIGLISQKGSEWGLNKLFNSSAENDKPIAPVARVVMPPQQSNAVRFGA